MSSFKEMYAGARNPPADPKTLSFKNKAVLVTGANSGLGHQAAIKYAAAGASPLILGVRTREKGEQARAAILRATSCDPGVLVIETVDLATLASVRAFAGRVAKRCPVLHVVQLAAGVAMFDYVKSPDGFEMTLQVNVLSTALMALLLLPSVSAAAAASSPDSPDKNDAHPHISFLSSQAAFEVKAEAVPPGQSLIQRLNNQAKFDNQQQYFLIKLASWAVMQGVLERSRDNGSSSGIVVNASCPGLCKTNMTREFPLVHRIIMQGTYALVGRSAEEGSRSMVSATGLGPESSGKLWRNDGFSPLSPLLSSPRGTELVHETWDEIMSILRKYVQDI
ncbi:hypothetical protein F4825DRAFT_310622 [Nemania diffusa]|nr:hypothetical protein F4825DRAFT_310622 [Nemania diffusa]